MKELEWIREMREDFESGDQSLFPQRKAYRNLEAYSVQEVNKRVRQSVRLAKAGDLDEIWAVAEYYFFGNKALNMPRNYEKSIYWYSRAAQYKSEYRGYALYQLAYCYKNSRGKNRDCKKAFEMLKALAEIDCSKIELYDDADFTAAAKVTLANCYYRGIGTEKNLAKAIAIWKEYAEKSDATACFNLGIEYRLGKYVTRDYGKAFYWTQKAAELGDVMAIVNLGWCYEKGHGTVKDMAKAAEYYRQAASRGDRIAKNGLKRLERKGVIKSGEDN